MPPAASHDPRLLAYAALAAGLVYLLYVLSPILTPFLFAAGLAYLGSPLVDRLEGWRMPRTLAAVLVLLGFLLAFVILSTILAPLVLAQVRIFLQRLPEWSAWVHGVLMPWIIENLGQGLTQDEVVTLLQDHLAQLAGLAAGLPHVAGQGFALLGALGALLLIPVVTFYLLRDWHRILAAGAQWVPLPWRPGVYGALREMDAVLSEFVRGQLGVVAVMVLIYSLGLWLIGLEYALAVGVVSGVLVIVPYLGLIVGVALGSLAAWTQFGGIAALIQVWAVFALGQLLEGMVITPWLVGERVGLHPVAVIFALLAFGQLFGFFGILLAIPASALLLVLLRRLRQRLTAPA